MTFEPVYLGCMSRASLPKDEEKGRFLIGKFLSCARYEGQGPINIILTSIPTLQRNLCAIIVLV